MAYPLGAGGSYSSWSSAVEGVAPPAISAAELRGGGNVTVTVRLRNAAGPAGSRVCYGLLRRVGAAPQEQWPAAWLPRGGFVKLHGVAAGGEGVAALVLGGDDFSRWAGAGAGWEVRPGSYVLDVRDGGVAEVEVTA